MEVRERWWEDFFTGMFNDCWRRLRWPIHTAQEADFIEAELPRPGSAILDVPCGGGRIALELAARGHHVVGVDLSDDFLSEARAASSERQLPVTWEKRDMRDLPWEEEFDAAICIGTSFGFLDDEGDREYIGAVHRALRPGGKFVIETQKLLEILLTTYKPRSWARLDDLLVIYEHEYDFARGRENTAYSFFRNGESESSTCSQRIYTYHEIDQLLRGAGFSTIQAYGTHDRKPLRLSSQRVFIVATK